MGFSAMHLFKQGNEFSTKKKPQVSFVQLWRSTRLKLKNLLVYSQPNSPRASALRAEDVGHSLALVSDMRKRGLQIQRTALSSLLKGCARRDVWISRIS